MKRPKIALVGRPNVGKSCLFNRITKKRIAIVDASEGVTRDRIYAETDVFGTPIQLIDTGGIDCDGSIPFWQEVKSQSEFAIDEADVVIMVVDGQIGLTRLDHEIARFLHQRDKPLVLAVNKVDTPHHIDMIHNFHGLGIETMIGVSAIQGIQIAELLEAALALVPDEVGEEPERFEGISVAILGRPNAGKSTLLNYLLDEERSIVSPIAGTTRDTIDAVITFQETQIRLIDTAGLRRKKKEPDTVDKFSRIRTERAIERADICLFMVDAREGITTEEKKILNEIEERGKGCVILFNKWDLVKGFRMEHCATGAKQAAPFLEHCPMHFGSAQEGRGVEKVLGSILHVYRELTKRITTGQLNKFLERAVQMNHPPMIQGKRLRIYYMTQVSVLPPHFVLFVNYPDRMTGSYQKYLINQFRETFKFDGVPLSFVLRKRASKERAERLELASSRTPFFAEDESELTFEDESDEDFFFEESAEGENYDD